MMKRCQCGNLLRAPREQERNCCLECQMAIRVLTPEEVAYEFPSTSWVKVAPTRIRAITPLDVQRLGDSFLNLEEQEICVAVGRYLCMGAKGKPWICSHVRDQVPVSEPDSKGFRLYVQLDPKPVACFDVPFPFVLRVGGKEWQSPETGGIIAWNGRTGPELDMRIVERNIFRAFYAPYDEQVKLLPVPVPPTFEECCGYTDEARFVAFFWGEGDESYYDDGKASGTGEWDGFQAFVTHWRVQPALRGFDLGSSEEPAKHWLLLDRHMRRVSVANTEVARQILCQQWKMPEQEEQVLIMDQEEWDRLVQEVSARIRTMSQFDDLAFVIAHQKRVSEMRAWLDRVGEKVPVS